MHSIGQLPGLDPLRKLPEKALSCQTTRTCRRSLDERQVLSTGAGLPFLGTVFTGLDLGAGEMIGAGAVLLVVGAGLVWAIVRDVPMKAAAE